MGKWPHLLLGTGSILGVVTAAWLAWGTTGLHAMSPETKHVEIAHEESGHPAKEGDLRYTARARATEDGFKAAFPLRQ